MDWFEKLVGFKEENPQQVRQYLKIEGAKLVSEYNGREMVYGKQDVPHLKDLRTRIQQKKAGSGKMRLSEKVGDIQEIHKNPANNHSVIQVASQFNLLEIVHPGIRPEDGVGIYENDHTKGPACAIACGAGTIYRNYFVQIDGKPGQIHHRQIDCLDDLGRALGNQTGELWEMKNGYALAAEEGLLKISEQLSNCSSEEYEALKGLVKVGIQWNSEVTLAGSDNRITQVYSSALPVSYSPVRSDLWEDFARFILEATYEATLITGILNYLQSGNNQVFLTLIGGGVFGNKREWIFDAMEKAILKFSDWPLDLKIVSYRRSDPETNSFINSLNL